MKYDIWGFAVIELLGHAIILTAALSDARAAALLTVGAWLTGIIAFYHPWNQRPLANEQLTHLSA